MHGNAYRRHDELSGSEMTPRIGKYIDGRFSEFLRQTGKSRFAEKTPSNCLRIPFIQALYPDCRIIHIIRDGRMVTKSMLAIRQSPPNRGLFRRKLEETPLQDWPAYLPMFFRTVWPTKILRKPARYWGPRPVDWWRWLDLPPHLIVARQWTAIVRKAVHDGRTLPAANYLELRFETLMAEPLRTVERLLEFTELKASSEVVDFAQSHIDPRINYRRKDSIGDSEEREVYSLIAPTLQELGYV